MPGQFSTGCDNNNNPGKQTNKKIIALHRISLIRVSYQIYSIILPPKTIPVIYLDVTKTGHKPQQIIKKPNQTKKPYVSNITSNVPIYDN